MRTRVQVVLETEERDLFQREAEREGLSLGSWLRKVAKDTLTSGVRSEPLTTRDELRAFFARCDAREKGKEPDWEDHLETIERSLRGGRAET